MNRAVITGATGTIGSSLVKLLESNGIETLVLVRPNSSRSEKIKESKFVSKKYCELADLKSFNDFDGDFDVFFHLGWDKTSVNGRDDTQSQLNNIKYTLDAVELANRMHCKVFVGAGSQAEYGVQNEPLTPTTPVQPESGYGIAKFAANGLSRLKANELGMRQSWARILSVYGENDASTTLISYLISSIENGEIPKLTKCEQIWDYVYADDCARALYLIAEKGHNGKSYPIGSGEKRLMKDYVFAVRNAINSNAQIDFGAKEYYPHQPMFLLADLTELTEDTGFKPLYTFEEGIARTIKLKRSNYGRK